MKTHSRICLSILLVVVMLFQINVSAVGVTHNDLSGSTDSKIDSNLYSKADVRENKYLVCLWRKTISDETIRERLKAKTKFDSMIYEDDVLYERTVVSAITRSVIAKFGNEEAYQPSEAMLAKGESVSRIEEALSEDYDQYILSKRRIISELYSEYNSSFINKQIRNFSEILYRGTYTGTIILYATKDEIASYARHDEVTRISPYVDEVQTPSLFAVQNQIGTDSSTGTKSTLYNNGSGYRGTNVKVGILEAGAGRYNSSATQLAPIPNTQLQYVANQRTDGTYVTPTITSHATMVTTLIVGQAVTVNGRLYEGVVPKATVYQMPVVYGSDVMNGISQLAALGVTVINYSGGSGNTLEYATYDREVDNVLKSTGITFVVAAGNAGNNDPTDDPDDPQYPCISSPGKAYNAITVGNLRTKSGTYTTLSPNYSINSSSSYDEASYMTAKPEVSAPGTSIAYVSTGTMINSATGTSCSAPLVTGMIAQLHQYRYTLRSNSTRTKAMVVIGASNSQISTVNNSIVGNTWIRDRSGAGLVSARRSMDIAQTYNDKTYSINLNTITGQPTYQTNVTLKSGQTIRIVMTFDKSEDGAISTAGYVNDVDLRLYESGSNTPVKSSISSFNNVEIIEYTASSDGNFNIEVKLFDFIPASSTTYLKIALVWAIE